MATNSEWANGIQACRRSEDHLLKFKMSIGMWKRGDCSVRGVKKIIKNEKVVVWSFQLYRGKWLDDVGSEWEDWLETTRTHITTGYKPVVQNNTSERTRLSIDTQTHSLTSHFIRSVSGIKRALIQMLVSISHFSFLFAIWRPKHRLTEALWQQQHGYCCLPCRVIPRSSSSSSSSSQKSPPLNSGQGGFFLPFFSPRQNHQ